MWYTRKKRGRNIRIALSGRRFAFFLLILCLAAASLPGQIRAHGSVTAEEDQCLIRIGYLSAHFKIYLPRRHGHQDFCEDLPDAGEAVFVMEYIHDDLGRLPVDFRIIRDVTGLGRFARVEDVEAIADLEAATVFYRPPAVEPEIFTVLHEFEGEGAYLGIVTARRPDDGRLYAAVFPFEVGFTGFGFWPLFLALILLVQLNWWFMNGRFSHLFRRKSNAGAKS